MVNVALSGTLVGTMATESPSGAPVIAKLTALVRPPAAIARIGVLATPPGVSEIVGEPTVKENDGIGGVVRTSVMVEPQASSPMTDRKPTVATSGRCERIESMMAGSWARVSAQDRVPVERRCRPGSRPAR
jgi:hypothetical protein